MAIAPAYFRIENGTLNGLSISAFNHIKGDLNGVSIGVFNYVNKINGVQIGILNYIRSNRKGLRLLPLFNARFN